MESTTTEACSVDEEDCSDSEVACLMRVGKKSEWLRLFENTEVTVGRGVNVTYQLLSASCPLMISRLHCTFKRKEDGQWTVTDKKSLNGVWVNGNRIPADEAHLLRVGDSVQLGVPVMGSRVEFDYILVQRPLKDIKLHLAKTHKEGATAALITASSKRKMSVEEDEPSTSKPKLYRCSSSDKSLAKACPPPLKKCQLQQSHSQPEETTSSRRVQKSRQRSEPPCDVDNLQMYSQNILLLRQQVDDTQRRVASLGGEDEPGDPLVREQVQELQSQLGTLRSKMHQMETLKKSFSERKWPEHQKSQQEEQMRKQLNDALQEQKKVIVEHALSRQAFEKILSAKNKELEATKEEKERARAQKDEVVTQMTEVLENELQCIICSELFIEAVTLNCAHSFCSYCINQWRKKKEECPICRQAITSQSRCLALDNFIERMMENLSLDVKEKRQSIINERKANATEVMVIHDDDSTSDSSSSDSSSLESDGSMLSIFSSSSSVFTVETENSDDLEFEISDDLED
ncbi:E3 ubiquitin-protein ligase rnf8 isoform X2 [Oryzias melastigma]|uniref:E3 ubiquitin-protein ligase CHFR n=1 Tax=Oryzias melastigma TaxID=30732 RepID=A0A3B3E0B7_ORYME|nr:E3 ubiquitin-protein ligase rnf8 isoform X2 [Oryzias melastigma]